MTRLSIAALSLIACSSYASGNVPEANHAASLQSDAGRQTQTQPCAGPIIVEDSSVAGIRIGMSAERVRAACSVVDTFSQMMPGDTEPVKGLFVRIGADTVRVLLFADTVDAIHITSRNFVAEGIRVGDPLAKLLETPGAFGLVGEASLAVVLPKHCGIWFVIGGVHGLETGDELRKTDLEKYSSHTVTEIHVIGCAGWAGT